VFEFNSFIAGCCHFYGARSFFLAFFPLPFFCPGRVRWAFFVICFFFGAVISALVKTPAPLFSLVFTFSDSLYSPVRAKELDSFFVVSGSSSR